MELNAEGPEGLARKLCGFFSCEPEDLWQKFLDWWAAGEEVVLAHTAEQRLQELHMWVTENHRNNPSPIVNDAPTLLSSTRASSLHSSERPKRSRRSVTFE